jgi:hypothetical protein
VFRGKRDLAGESHSGIVEYLGILSPTRD